MKTAKMSRQHFELIAEMVRTSNHICGPFERVRIAEHFANYLARTNPLFRRDLFLAACGVTPEDR